mmetsp:Transcript_19142/g.27230  ORF Transcript_19142/g.27230 Transcript_19142/m.27230 type:complete len:183 (-) Transcript_19142:1645-2193(-)|eukprot:CAMPEP_0172431036 /NCGR_PEP_ID=MMETSP1064-20121228/57001_1 /TAXON_ID=202472 /ORGANISM="Aulacoseira subarctica , Strain CCAP 1002/5" /LENGTH=182 /DNA_ID=CAMNT_0013177497 /DNA_START=90 /DNA_END=638 /DNA_ORIENTATION=-
MSEESKIDHDYVHMHAARPGTGANVFMAPKGLDDPNLTQEERDLRLAIALQQQENAAAQAGSSQKLHDAEKADVNRTGRSGVYTKLANVRAKDHGMLSVPKEYNNDSAYVNADYIPPMSSTFKGTPQEMADHEMAMNLHRAEISAESVGATAEKMFKKEKEIDEAQEHRTARSGVPVRPSQI